MTDHPNGVRRILNNAAHRALATRHASVPALGCSASRLRLLLGRLPHAPLRPQT